MLCAVATPTDFHAEGAWRRARRDAVAAIESWRFLFAALVFDTFAAMAAYAVTNDPGQDRSVKVATVGGAVIVGPFLLGLAVLLALWVTAPVRQRNEARAQLAQVTEARKFPRGRIEVTQYGYFDTQDAERLLVFGVKVTNREVSRRMNLELDFILRLFTRITHYNPTLKPLEARLSLVQRGPDPPPAVLVVDAQDSSDPTYVARWDLETGLAFDEDASTFTPELEGDTLFLRVFDLQSGERIEIEVPGVWES